MVSKPVNQRTAIRRGPCAKKAGGGRTKNILFFALFILVCLFSMRVCFFVFDNSVSLTGVNEGGCPEIGGSMISSSECMNTGTVTKITRVDFQPVVNEFVLSSGGEKGVVIYDLDLNEVVGEYNADKVMRIESIYKLFVVYEGYLRVSSGEWSADGACGNTGMTILKCLDIAIRESSSYAAEALWGMIGRGTLDEIVHTDFGLFNVTVGSISASAREVMEMMKKFYYHTEITDANLVATMKDSFLNQPPSAGLCSGPCVWRQGLPSGFSDEVDVYNKVGWLGNGAGGWIYYADAAILDFKNAGRKYITVVLTSGISYKKIAELGSAIEQHFNDAV